MWFTWTGCTALAESAEASPLQPELWQAGLCTLLESRHGAAPLLSVLASVFGVNEVLTGGRHSTGARGLGRNGRRLHCSVLSTRDPAWPQRAVRGRNL